MVVREEMSQRPVTPDILGSHREPLKVIGRGGLITLRYWGGHWLQQKGVWKQYSPGRI